MTPDRIEVGKYAHFGRMIFNLNVVLDYNSPDLPGKIRLDIKNYCTSVERIITEWVKAHRKPPPKEVYEKVVIEPLTKFKWLKLKL